MGLESLTRSTWADITKSYSPSQIDVVGTLAVQLIFFWALSGIYILLDILFPHYSHPHKLQPRLKQPTLPELRECFWMVARNQMLSTLIHVGIYAVLHLFRLPPSLRFDAALPSLAECIREISLSMLMREVFFYYSHRILHHPSIYPRIHKTHHRFTAPVALAAQYAHPIEHLVANILPIVLPSLILRSHIVTFWIFLAIELAETTTVHSGYDFLHGAAKMHDLHHEKFVVNYGTLGLLDWVHGTGGKSARKHMAESR
ncbi:hypothetical protein BOTBODRAFT_31639 [Botryobasidium botryosum FD-172 SS1]|uniref:Fatty acid hydroxylase domain-containing protein n=1 Tax=Botryobasidium botryosum (strain FD-172 SS1) TaxID=930990 RepID=A0A067MJ01_BOTB1|nr:hypothetical protein BOTBODRAFT_31639 [Botryobasidium botryosum FD-172 SS1]